MRPEKIYTGFLKLGVVISIFISLIVSIALIFFLKSNGFEVSWVFAIVLPLVTVIGTYLRYQLNMNVEGFAGKTIKSKNQRHIKQYLYVLFPFGIVLLASVPSYIISEYSLLGYIAIIFAAVSSEILFFRRLKNLEIEEGKDTQPIMNIGEIILFSIFVLFIGSMIILLKVAS
ncbi:MAG: hypothetical protein HN981_03050 [Candidatus Pacebacteria bacterium]|nr:hypothetical protein [Candidatus Paceibacterota bacterium]